MNAIAPYAKAIIAALVAGLTALSTGGFTKEGIIGALIALLVAGGAVFSIPNRSPFISPEDVAAIKQEPTPSDTVTPT